MLSRGALNGYAEGRLVPHHHHARALLRCCLPVARASERATDHQVFMGLCEILCRVEMTSAMTGDEGFELIRR